MRRSVRSEVDFVLTFEEMAGIFDAKHVDLENMEEDPDGVSDASTDGRNFAVAGGVAQAVVDVIKRDHPEQEIKVANAEGLKECRQLLKLATLGKYPGYLLEGMACPGGCVAGAGTMQAIKKSQTAVGLYAKKQTISSQAKPNTSKNWINWWIKYLPCKKPCAFGNSENAGLFVCSFILLQFPYQRSISTDQRKMCICWFLQYHCQS